MRIIALPRPDPMRPPRAIRILIKPGSKIGKALTRISELLTRIGLAAKT